MTEPLKYFELGRGMGKSRLVYEFLSRRKEDKKMTKELKEKRVKSIEEEFKEQFPSLINTRLDFCTDEGHQDRGPHMALCCDGRYFDKNDIQKFCLDKQKVREAIDIVKWESGTSHEFIANLKKELGLND